MEVFSIVNLIVGGDSLIGSTLSDYWIKKNIPFHSSTRHEEMVEDYRPLIDLNNIGNYLHFNNYTNVIICAAITNIVECENNPERTRKVNVLGTLELAKQFSKSGSCVVFLSSNEVFDGVSYQFDISSQG